MILSSELLKDLPSYSQLNHYAKLNLTRQRPSYLHQEAGYVTVAHSHQNAVLSLAGFSAISCSGFYHNLLKNISFHKLLLFVCEGVHRYMYVHMEARS